MIRFGRIVRAAAERSARDRAEVELGRSALIGWVLAAGPSAVVAEVELSAVRGGRMWARIGAARRRGRLLPGARRPALSMSLAESLRVARSRPGKPGRITLGIAGTPRRSRDLCLALDLGTEAKYIQAMRDNPLIGHG